MMFVGYSTNNGSEVYHMFIFETKIIILSRDIKWLNKMYFMWNRE